MALDYQSYQSGIETDDVGVEDVVVNYYQSYQSGIETSGELIETKTRPALSIVPKWN